MTEREIHMMLCKHWDYELCCLKSYSDNGWHIEYACDGKCARMKRYDKKHQEEPKKEIENEVSL